MLNELLYSYLIIIKGLMPSVVEALHHVSGSDSTLPWYLLSGRFWIAVFMVVLVPLCFLRRLDSLRHTSYIAMFTVGEVPSISLAVVTVRANNIFAVYLVTIVIVCHFHPPKGSADPGEWHLIRFTPSFISTFPAQIFGFTCSQNVCPAIISV